MTKKRTIVFRHVLVWGLYIVYELLLIQVSVGLTTPPFHLAVYYLLNISLFYFNAHVILNYAFFKTPRPYLIASILILIEILVYLVLKFEIDLVFSGANSFNFNVANERLLMTNIFREIFFIGFSIAYWSMLYMMRFKERNHQMEKEHLQAIASTLELENRYISVENAYLQNQISPHLLFNSLSFIHNQVYKESAVAGDSVSRLADLMRYSLVSSDDSRTVLLSAEVSQLENLVQLCRIRFQDQFFFRFRKKGKLSNVNILPLILITLVENMMKHGDMGDAKYPAKVKLELEGNLLSFETLNKKRNTKLYPKGGLGLKNIEKRLRNFYQDKYSMLVREEDELFTVNLIIQL